MEIAEESIFHKIINREIPADIIYEDESAIAIKDINPVAEFHYLVIPKKTVPKLSDANEEDKELLGHLLLVAKKLASDAGFLEDGFRVVINNGEGAGQTVFQLHLHVLGGREFSWPPG